MHVSDPYPARHGRAARTLQLALVAGLLSLVVFANMPGTIRFFYLLQKLAHPVVFGTVAMLVLSLLRPAWRHRTLMLYLAAFLVTVALGAATEILQMFTHRDPAVRDVLRDALGAATALAAWAAAAEPALAVGMAKGTRRAALAVALLGAGTMSAPMMSGLLAYAHRDRAFPVLAEFDSWLDEYFLGSLDNPSTDADPAGPRRVMQPARFASTQGEHALSVPLRAAQWTGVTLDEPYPDWRGRTVLLVDLTNPSPTAIDLTLRIHDRGHNQRYEDRFNRTLPLPAAARTVFRVPVGDIEAAPRGRRMDLQHIAGIVIFLPGSPANPPAFLLNRVWLE